MLGFIDYVYIGGVYGLFGMDVESYDFCNLCMFKLLDILLLGYEDVVSKVFDCVVCIKYNL